MVATEKPLRGRIAGETARSSFGFLGSRKPTFAACLLRVVKTKEKSTKAASGSRGISKLHKDRPPSPSAIIPKD